MEGTGLRPVQWTSGSTVTRLSVPKRAGVASKLAYTPAHVDSAVTVVSTLWIVVSFPLRMYAAADPTRPGQICSCM